MTPARPRAGIGAARLESGSKGIASFQPGATAPSPCGPGALVDGLDLHGQIKVAHWNVKGPHFAALHPLFETFAVALAGFNDEVAERAVTLGAAARGTARTVARTSRLPDYPEDLARDLEHVRVLADRFDAYLKGVREARDAADREKDQDTVDLLTGIAEEFEKNAWFLRATLAA